MNKTDREYLMMRVANVVKCTNGNIATILNRKKKGTGLTDSRKYEMIASGKATVKTENQLVKISMTYKHNAFDTLLDCFDYPTTQTQAEKLAYNKIIDNKIEGLMQEVELEGKRLVDAVVLGITTLEDVPDALHRLGEMANLARTCNDLD